MRGGGDNNAEKYIKIGDAVPGNNDHKAEEQNMVGGLRVIELPPPPKEFCTMCDPVMKTNLRLAIFSTFFCWLPLGIVPVIFGLISIFFALKAEKCDDSKQKQLLSNWSNTISWIGMILFVTVLTVAVVIIATLGIL